MKKLRQFTLVLIGLFGLLSQSFAQEVNSGEYHGDAERWLQRAKTCFQELDKDEQASEANFMACCLAQMGEIDAAKNMVKELVLPDLQDHALVMIAGVQSSCGQLEQAIVTAGEFESEAMQEAALSFVAAHQARQGHIEDAIGLLAKITRQHVRDRVLKAITEAQVRAGDMDAARASSKQIAKATYYQRQAQKAISSFGTDPIRKVNSGFLRDRIGAMMLFSSYETYHEAISAIAAAQADDDAALTKHIEAALEATEDLSPLKLATMHTLLAAAFAEAGRTEDARQMILKARESNSDEPLGISSLFGNPILVHLLIRLDMTEELEDLIGSPGKDEIISGSDLCAVGTAYVDLDRLDEAEHYFEQIELPSARLNLAFGVMEGLANYREE